MDQWATVAPSFSEIQTIGSPNPSCVAANGILSTRQTLPDRIRAYEMFQDLLRPFHKATHQEKESFMKIPNMNQKITRRGGQTLNRSSEKFVSQRRLSIPYEIYNEAQDTPNAISDPPLLSFWRTGGVSTTPRCVRCDMSDQNDGR